MRYRTIVADPPWEIGDFPRWSNRSGRNPTPYPTMSLDEIKALPVKRVAEADKWHVNGDRGGCNLFLWTTARYLYDAHDVARAWGFKPTGILIWCKEPMGVGLGGNFKSNAEFIVVGRRGSPPRATSKSATCWFTWPRGRHSEKPEAFFDLVEEISVGPYLELFARRQRLGWNTWGNEALEHVDLKVPVARFQDADRGAERRYESWLESLKDHGP